MSNDLKNKIIELVPLGGCKYEHNGHDTWQRILDEVYDEVVAHSKMEIIKFLERYRKTGLQPKEIELLIKELKKCR
jgi:hypothetical protein